MLSKTFSVIIGKIKQRIPVPAKETLKRYQEKIAVFFLSILEPLIGRYITFHTRPIVASGVLVERKDRTPDYAEYAIVMQGPLMTKDDFTLETLALYKQFVPNASLILSTWVGEDADSIDRIKQLGVEVILNDKPAHAGARNINLQIVSSSAGILRAAELQKKYVLKTRTDARLYSQHALSFLSDVLKSFPITAPDSKQKGRLISAHGSPSKLYFCSDMLVFGYAEDVRLYFGADLVSDTATMKVGDALLPLVPEQYFFMEFLKKVGHTLTYTPGDSLRAQARYVVVLDIGLLDWYWHKYDRHREHRAITYRRKKRVMGFPEWLHIYTLYGDGK